MRRAAVAGALLVGCGGGGSPIGRAPVPAVHATVGDLDGARLLSEVAARASALGAGAASTLATGAVSAGERLGAFVDVPDDACLLSYARASSSLEDIDVAVFAEEGNPVAVDEGPDAHPTILLCPPHPARVYAAVHAASGEGLVALGAQIVPRDRASDVGRALHAHGAKGGATAADAWPGLSERVAAHRARIGGAWEEGRRVAVAIDERAPTVVTLPIAAGECVDAWMSSDDDSSMLDVEAMDDAGRVIARANDGSKEVSLIVCTDAPVKGTLVLRPHIGAGVAAVVLSHGPSSLAKDLTAKVNLAWSSPLPLPQARASLEAELTKESYASPTSATQLSTMLGRRVTVPIDARDGCRRVDVVLGAPAGEVEASLWDDKGGLVSQGVGASSVTLFSCAKGKLSVDVDARGRGGPAVVLVRPERWQSPAFLAHPLAASRMMVRASSGPFGALDGTLGPGRALDLDASHRETWETSLAPSSCVLESIGAEGEGTGVSLVAIDAASGDVLDRGAARLATSVRACAGAAGRKVRFEAKATSGKLTGVVGERVRATP